MRRSLSGPDRGSALVEATLIGSLVFLIATAAAAAAIEVSIRGGEARESADVIALQAARHGDLRASDRVLSTVDTGVVLSGSGDSIRVVVTTQVMLPHPGGSVANDLVGVAEVPIAPYRSGRG